LISGYYRFVEGVPVASEVHIKMHPEGDNNHPRLGVET
jgi:hypothetical protein